LMTSPLAVGSLRGTKLDDLAARRWLATREVRKRSLR
jgi:hypothetical protein